MMCHDEGREAAICVSLLCTACEIVDKWHTPLKNGVGILEAFFHFFLGLVPCRNHEIP